MSSTQSLTQLFALDHLLEPEEIQIRDTVRKFAAERIRPHIAEWFEAASLPARELAKEFGSLGLEWCAERGVLVRAFAGTGVRVSIGAPEEMAAFLDAATAWTHREHQ